MGLWSGHRLRGPRKMYGLVPPRGRALQKVRQMVLEEVVFSAQLCVGCGREGHLHPCRSRGRVSGGETGVCGNRTSDFTPVAEITQLEIAVKGSGTGSWDSTSTSRSEQREVRAVLMAPSLSGSDPKPPLSGRRAELSPGPAALAGSSPRAQVEAFPTVSTACGPGSGEPRVRA